MAWTFEDNPELAGLKDYIDVGLDPTSGMSSLGSIVRNPSQPGFQLLNKVSPAMAAKMKALPDWLYEFRKVAPESIKGFFGYAQPGRVGGVGATAIKYASDLNEVLPETLVHEGLHGLYDAKNAAVSTAQGLAPQKYAYEIYSNIMDKLGYAKAYTDRVLWEAYGGDAAHAAIEAMSQNILKRGGHPIYPRELL